MTKPKGIVRGQLCCEAVDRRLGQLGRKRRWLAEQTNVEYSKFWKWLKGRHAVEDGAALRLARTLGLGISNIFTAADLELLHEPLTHDSLRRLRSQSFGVEDELLWEAVGRVSDGHRVAIRAWPYRGFVLEVLVTPSDEPFLCIELAAREGRIVGHFQVGVVFGPLGGAPFLSPREDRVDVVVHANGVGARVSGRCAQSLTAAATDQGRLCLLLQNPTVPTTLLFHGTDVDLTLVSACPVRSLRERRAELGHLALVATDWSSPSPVRSSKTANGSA